MIKDKNTQFVCGECGADYLKWQGKCDACGAWNSLKEISINIKKGKSSSRKGGETQAIRLDEIQAELMAKDLSLE